MYSAPLPMMLLLVIGLYLGTYGPGRLGLRLLWLEVGSRPERIGLSCALGAAILGWLGYAAALLASPLLASAVGWAAIALGSGMALRDFWRKDEPCDLTSQTRAGLGLAIILGWAIAAGLSGGQIIHHADGGLAGRFVWPDRLYRNAVLHRLMACSGPPDWPWLAGVPLKGMSLLRYAALVPLFKALGISSLYYQDAACWLGLYGVPIATFTAFAFFRALGASALVSWAVVLTACLGNPRWLLNDRFAHSPALHWAGHDVFAICVPVLFAMLALIAHAIRTQHKGALALAALMLASGLGQEPWMSLAVYPAVLFYCVIMLARREKIHEGLVLALGALVGLAVLKFGMGTSTTARGSLLHALGPSPTIRNLAWAFPFLAEPLRPLLAQPGLMSLLKLAKFASVYAVAVVFYIYGSLWMRLIIVPSAYRFPWPRLREPIWIFGACLVASGILLSSLVNFDKLAYSFAHYDTLRVLWPALLLANLGVAFWLVEKWPLLRRGWGFWGWLFGYTMAHGRMCSSFFGRGRFCRTLSFLPMIWRPCVGWPNTGGQRRLCSSSQRRGPQRGMQPVAWPDIIGAMCQACCPCASGLTMRIWRESSAKGRYGTRVGSEQSKLYAPARRLSAFSCSRRGSRGLSPKKRG